MHSGFIEAKKSKDAKKGKRERAGVAAPPPTRAARRPSTPSSPSRTLRHELREAPARHQQPVLSWHFPRHPHSQRPAADMVVAVCEDEAGALVATNARDAPAVVARTGVAHTSSPHARRSP